MFLTKRQQQQQLQTPSYDDKNHEYFFKETDVNKNYYNETKFLHGSNNNKCTNVLKVLVGLFFLLFWNIHVLEKTPMKLVQYIQERQKIKKSKSLLENDQDLQGLEHQHSSATISVDYITFLRDVVWELPVFDEDVAFYWDFSYYSSLSLSNSNEDSRVIQKILNKCFQLDLSEGHSDISISQHHRTRGVISSDVIMMSQLFTDLHRGRMFAMFRHPFYEYLTQNRRRSSIDNPLTRHLLQLTNSKEPITIYGLGLAKKIIREKCVVGVLTKPQAMESLLRIGAYFGWNSASASSSSSSASSSCVQNYLKQLSLDSMDTQESLERHSKWKAFIETNYFDWQLYEFIQSLFRAHRQTIIPRDQQISIKNDDDDTDDAAS